MARLAVVGVGHLGKEHARILSGMPGVELVGVVDPNRTQAEAVAERCKCRAFPHPGELVSQIDAAVIAAPTSHHHAVAHELLDAGVHLLIEKPLTTTPAEGRDLVELAARRDVIVQVGHIERFNPAFEELQTLPLRPCYVRVERCGGFTGRSMDVGVVLDLMIHDLDLLLALTRSSVRRVEALGVAVLGQHEDMAQARLVFANGCVADLSASRVHPEARRQMHVWGPEGYAGVDFANRTLTLMEPGEHLRSKESRRRDVDCSSRHRADQLTRELEEFVRCVRTGATPRVSGQEGLEALELAGRVLAGVASHQWEGHVNGAVGPRQVPIARGSLIAEPMRREAA